MKPDKEPTSVDEALDTYWVDKSVIGHVPNCALNFEGAHDYVTELSTVAVSFIGI